MFSFRRVLVPVLSCLSCLSCLSLLLSLSLPCPALSGLCFPLQLRRCKYRAVPVPLAPFALVCHRYLPCPASFGRSPLRREQGSRGSWYLAASPLVHCVYPPLSGRALFFSSGTFTKDCRLGRPSSWGAPVTTTVDTPPSHSFILRLALRVSPPTVCFCRACMCMQFAGWPRVGPPPEPKTSATARDCVSGSLFRHCPMSL